MEQNVMTKNSESVQLSQFLTFYDGNEIYGIPVSRSKEVIEFSRVYAIPKTPQHIRGVINLRGEVIPVLDLSYILYGQPSVVKPASSIIFIEVKDQSEMIIVGLMIDAVEAVISLSEENIEHVADFSAKINPKYISGIGKYMNKFIIMLNLDELVNIDELSQYE